MRRGKGRGESVRRAMRSQEQGCPSIAGTGRRHARSARSPAQGVPPERGGCFVRRLLRCAPQPRGRDAKKSAASIARGAHALPLSSSSCMGAQALSAARHLPRSMAQPGSARSQGSAHRSWPGGTPPRAQRHRRPAKDCSAPDTSLLEELTGIAAASTSAMHAILTLEPMLRVEP